MDDSKIVKNLRNTGVGGSQNQTEVGHFLVQKWQSNLGLDFVICSDPAHKERLQGTHQCMYAQQTAPLITCILTADDNETIGMCGAQIIETKTHLKLQPHFPSWDKSQTYGLFS